MASPQQPSTLRLRLQNQFDFAKRACRFVGTKTLKGIIYSAVLGLVLSFIEIILAYGLQAFLVVLGISDPAALNLPASLPKLTVEFALLAVCLASVLRGVVQGIQAYFQASVHEVFKSEQRARVIRWVFTSRSVSTSYVATLFTERAHSAAMVLSFVQTFVSHGGTTVLLCISLFLLSSKMTVLVLTPLILFAIPFRWVNRKSHELGSELVSSWEATNRRLLLSIRNLLLVRIHGTASSEEKHSQKTLSKYLESFLRYYAIGGFIRPIPQVAGVVIICVALVIARKNAWESPGTLVSFCYVFVRFIQNASTAVTAFADVNFYGPQFKEMLGWWEKQQLQESVRSVKPALLLQEKLHEKGPLGWVVDRVSFAFSLSAESIFSNFHLVISPGSCTVITGPSGVGKSTLINLLIGEVDPSKGEVRVISDTREMNINDVRDSLLNYLGYVGADSFIVDGTVRQNLLYGLNREPTDSEIQSALRNAECDFLNDLPNALEHTITEQGVGLSAGQKQRLALARALLRNPKALILDEATANLDQETEERLIETLRRLKGQTTIVAVTHRKALLAIADQHIVLPRKAGAL